jgi:hypothetical protein
MAVLLFSVFLLRWLIRMKHTRLRLLQYIVPELVTPPPLPPFTLLLLPVADMRPYNADTAALVIKAKPVTIRS